MPALDYLDDTQQPGILPNDEEDDEELQRQRLAQPPPYAPDQQPSYFPLDYLDQQPQGILPSDDDIPPVPGAKLLPPEQAMDESDEGGQSTPAPSTTSPQQPPTNPYLQKELDLLGQYPQRPTPKWWQRALGAAAGAAAGVSNAASRTRNPIDIGRMEENILAPGYSAKVAQFNSQLQPLEKQAEVASGQTGQWWKNQQLQSELAYRKAEADRAEKQGEWYSSRLTPWKINTKTGQLYNTQTGQVAAPPQTTQERMQAMLSMGFSPEEARYLAVGQKPPVASKAQSRPVIVPAGATLMGDDGKPLYTNPREFAPRADNSLARELQQERIDNSRTDANTKLDQWKMAEERRVQDALAAQMEKPNFQPEMLPQLRANAAQQLQSIAATYARTVESRNPGVKAPRFRINPQTLASERISGTPAPTQGGPLTEQIIRQQAIAAGKDADAAVAKAKKNKLIP